MWFSMRQTNAATSSERKVQLARQIQGMAFESRIETLEKYLDIGSSAWVNEEDGVYMRSRMGLKEVKKKEGGEDEVEPERTKEATSTSAAPRPVGRPRKTPSREIHKRYRRRLRGKRKSDRCFINTALSPYLKTASLLADKYIRKRKKRKR